MTSLPIHLLFFVNLVIIGSAYLILARKGFIFSSLWLGLLVYVAIGYSDIDNAGQIFREDVIISSLAYAMFASVLLLACFVAFWYMMSAGPICLLLGRFLPICPAALVG